MTTGAVIVAAFEPFGGRGRNRARDAAHRVDRTPIAAGGALAPVEIAELPTVFAALPARLAALLAASPRALLLVGESAAARQPQVEAVALNVAWARIPDNAGAQPRGAPLVDGGPPARFAAHAELLVTAIRDAGVAAALSFHAGTFCCNAALYHALGHADGIVPTAFVHLPARWPFASDARGARALRAAAEALARSGSASGDSPSLGAH